jgi:asparagine synthase (glutamine-hydrolysing)
MSGLCAVIDFSGNAVSRPLVGSMAAIASAEPGAAVRILGSGSAMFSSIGSRLAREVVAFEPGESKYLVAADARIDNRRELEPKLREELRVLAHEPGSASSSALIMAAYLRWGDQLAEHLLGDFAFILWNEDRRHLLAGRDALGIKSLHYAQMGQVLVLATEATQILVHPGISSDFDDRSIGDFLCGNIQDPCRTLFAAVQKVPPAHWLRADPRGISKTRYWSPVPQMGAGPKHEEEAAEAIQEILSRAVQDRLQEAVGPTAVSISGGLDSCAVAALACRALGNLGPEDLVLGSLIFPGLAECDERYWVELMAKSLGCQAEWIDVQKFSYRIPPTHSSNLETVDEIWNPSYAEILRRFRHKGCQVMLTGIGGDDLMAGSAKVFTDRLLGGDLRVLSKLWRHARRQGKNPLRFFYCYLLEPLLPTSMNLAIRRGMGRGGDRDVPAWLAADFLKRTGLRARTRRVISASWGRQAQAEIVHNIEPGSFGHAVSWLDRHAARFGIEARHPFLDRRLVELTLSLPPRLLFKLGSYKHLLRQSMQGVLPEKIRLREDKTRLSGYIDSTLRGLGAEAQHLLNSPILERLGLVDGKKLRHALDGCLVVRPNPGLRRVWYALMMEIWLQKYYNSFNCESRSQDSVARRKFPALAIPG